MHTVDANLNIASTAFIEDHPSLLVEFVMTAAHTQRLHDQVNRKHGRCQTQHRSHKVKVVVGGMHFSAHGRRGSFAGTSTRATPHKHSREEPSPDHSESDQQDTEQLRNGKSPAENLVHNVNMILVY